MKSVKKKFNNIKNIFKNNGYLYQYPIYYNKLEIKKNQVLIESTHGKVVAGHMFYILKELCENYKHLKVHIVAKEPAEVEKFLNSKNIYEVNIVEHLSKEYCKLLASVEYLLNDTTFYPFFNKKENQKYINIWHGTPLKTLGKDVDVITEVANVQRNFYMADKIISSNMYTQNILADSHSLNGVYNGKMVVGPSPRNSILKDKFTRDKVRNELNVSGNKVCFYMPTWRGHVGKVNDNNEKILDDLTVISRNLDEDVIFYVKLHPFQNDIDLDDFDNINLIPEEYELYEFLTAVDTLITDYSSVMYDFLLTNREIILYTYDKEEYLSTRGVYEDIDSYPFKQVDRLDLLISELNNEDSNTPINYTYMKDKFTPNDVIDGTAILCEYLFSNVSHDLIQEKELYNGKETVAILSGGFWDNGITTALLNTLDNIDVTEKNYMVFFGKNKLKKEHYFRVKNLPENVIFYPVAGTVNGTFFDRVVHSNYMKIENLNSKWIKNRISKMYQNDFKRVFGDLEINHFIHYTGFERKYAEMIQHIPRKINKVIFVHTDMFQEYEAKKNFSKKIIFSAYKNVDKVAIVNDNLKANLVKYIPEIERKINTVNNFLGENRVRELSLENIFSTIIPINIDYAYNEDYRNEFPNIQLPYLMDHRSDFFESSDIYSLYNNIKMTESEMSALREAGNETAAVKLENKLGFAEQLLILNTLHLTKSRLLDDIFNNEIKIFINIGRYDYQKGHERLIEAFEKAYLNNPDIRLIIVAPHGSLKSETISWVKNSKARTAIYLLGRMSNPYSLLKYCDAFILSSHYEGLGLVVYEALALNTDVITVNLPETIQYLQNDEAIIVENSEEGIYEGIIIYLNNSEKKKKFDFSIPKGRSLLEFENLFNK